MLQPTNVPGGYSVPFPILTHTPLRMRPDPTDKQQLPQQEAPGGPLANSCRTDRLVQDLPVAGVVVSLAIVA